MMEEFIYKKGSKSHMEKKDVIHLAIIGILLVALLVGTWDKNPLNFKQQVEDVQLKLLTSEYTFNMDRLQEKILIEKGYSFQPVNSKVGNQAPFEVNLKNIWDTPKEYQILIEKIFGGELHLIELNQIAVFLTSSREGFDLGEPFTLQPNETLHFFSVFKTESEESTGANFQMLIIVDGETYGNETVYVTLMSEEDAIKSQFH